MVGVYIHTDLCTRRVCHHCAKSSKHNQGTPALQLAVGAVVLLVSMAQFAPHSMVL
jgi:hypothetical protein